MGASSKASIQNHIIHKGEKTRGGDSAELFVSYSAAAERLFQFVFQQVPFFFEAPFFSFTVVVLISDPIVATPTPLPLPCY